MDHCESADKDADRAVLRENSEAESLVMRSNCDGESLVVMSNWEDNNKGYFEYQFKKSGG